MRHTPRDFDKLAIYVVAELARKRQARGLQLDYPEAVIPFLRGYPGGHPRWPPDLRVHGTRQLADEAPAAASNALAASHAAERFRCAT